MASAQYLVGRKKYSRPQAILWADNPGSTSSLDLGNGEEQLYYVPDGYEVLGQKIDPEVLGRFLILSDDNRDPIDFQVERIERRERMINGRMRSFHVADKLNLSLSWTMLPSRTGNVFAGFRETSGRSLANGADIYTTDAGAGGVEMLEWYENNTGPFWVYLAYDKYTAFGPAHIGESSPEIYNRLPIYNQVVEMFFSNFSYSVVKRNGSSHDYWNINLTLEEV
jgi:hypothetical protein